MSRARHSLVPWPWQAELGPQTVAAGSWHVRTDTPELEDAAAWFVSAAAHAGMRFSPGGLPIDVSIHQGVSRAPETAGVDPRGVPVDERYVLTIREEGVRVEGESAAGAFRALTTLLQLAEQSPELPIGAIDDGPKYAWRGLMLDVVRHPFRADEIEAVIDLLARYRFNVLHLHLTDSEGWMLESTVRPELSAEGAPSRVPALTLDEYRRIVDHAELRHIVVVPEVDLPGHALAAIRAYPELGGDQLSGRPPKTYLDPARPGFRAFVEDVVTEFAQLAPAAYVHVGGDEPFGMPHEQYCEAVREAVETARRAGRRVVAWQEAVRSGCLGPGDVVQYWVGPQNVMDPEKLKAKAPPAWHDAIDAAAETFRLASGDMPAAIDGGHPILVSNSDVLYLDHRYAEPAATAEGEERRSRLGFADYPARTLREMGDWSVEDMAALRGATIAGVEAAVWSESIECFDDLAFLLLPRLATVAERAWTHHLTDWVDHRSRLSEHDRTWARTGWGAAFVPARGEDV